MNKSENSSHSSMASRSFPMLLLLFAGSGCAALIYEIVWYQLLEFTIGASAISLSVLLATFMGGLCIGSIALPRINSVRRFHPLRVYAAIETGIGLCGVLILFAMPLVNRIYVAALNHGLSSIFLRGVVCSLCLLFPTILMGASLPAIARWVEAAPQQASRISILYGANIAGAVVGCLVAGFYLLRVFSLPVATDCAVALNFAIALVSFRLSVETRNDAPGLDPVRSRRIDRNGLPIYFAIALSGACALGAEVVWTRLLGLIFGATVYAFSIILAVFLVGLALGNAVGSVLSRRINPQRMLGYCQLLLAPAIAWTALMLARLIPYWPANPKLHVNPWFTFQVDLVRAIVALLPATVLWGASFALALAAVSSHDDDSARPVAAIYAANTCGAVLGALGFSVLLIPQIGTHGAQRVLILLSSASALTALIPEIAKRPMRLNARAVAWLAPALGLIALLTLAMPAIPAKVIAYGRLVNMAGDSHILYVGEGLNSSIAVSQVGKMRQFHVSGKSEASSSPYDMRVQRMLGHLPALFNPNPRSVLIVGFGAGVTAGSFVVNPEVQRISVCEIEPLVPPTTTRYFGEQNYNVLHDPRTSVIYEDARHFILTTPEKFDIITSDPIHPWVKGSATLYTKEYFELVKSHLNAGGVVAQWVPLYETDLPTVKSELATFFDVFPNGTIWGNDADGEGYDVVLIGQAGAAKINVDELQRRLDRPDYAGVVASLREVGLESAVKIVATYAGQAPDLSPWLHDAQTNRDANLRLQYLAGLAVNSSAEDAIYDSILRYRRFPSELIVGSDQYVQAIRSQHPWE